MPTPRALPACLRSQALRRARSHRRLAFPFGRRTALTPRRTWETATVGSACRLTEARRPPAAEAVPHPATGHLGMVCIEPVFGDEASKEGVKEVHLEGQQPVVAAVYTHRQRLLFDAPAEAYLREHGRTRREFVESATSPLCLAANDADEHPPHLDPHAPSEILLVTLI